MRDSKNQSESSNFLEKLTESLPINKKNFLIRLIDNSYDKKRCVANLERWLKKSASPEESINNLLLSPQFASRVITLFSSSQSLSDSIIQNPELALLLSEYDDLQKEVNVETIYDEGKRLLDDAHSFQHKLDRIRFLKQQWNIKIAVMDLTSEIDQDKVWQAISFLADAIIRLTTEIVWQETNHLNLPITVVALGKLGTCELNYSSDIDLIFAISDDKVREIDDIRQKCEKLIRALTGKMGRGSLYRVDLRLRPFGKGGEIGHTISAIRNYYQNYAEPWEILALLKARACAGNKRVSHHFHELKDEVVYAGSRTDYFMNDIVSAKKRYEYEVKKKNEWDNHIKLGEGGIRDIEFLIQTLQLLTGKDNPRIKDLPTIEAITVANAIGILSDRDSQLLVESYRFFRQIEHRIQIIYDLQEHQIPMDESDFLVLTRMMNYRKPYNLKYEISKRKKQVRELLERQVPALKELQEHEKVIDYIKHHYISNDDMNYANKLFSNIEDKDSFISQLESDNQLRQRADLIIQHTPRYISDLMFHQDLWDVAFSQNVECSVNELPDIQDEFNMRLLRDNADWEEELSQFIRRNYLIYGLRHACHKDVYQTYSLLAEMANWSLLYSLERCGGKDIDIVALGRLGSRELLLPSDWDIFLLTKDSKDLERTQSIANDWMKCLRRINTAGKFMPIDTRLRAEGSSGIIIRSIESLLAYINEHMEPWEKIAFTRARSLRNWTETNDTINAVKNSGGWNEDSLEELMKVRKRVQNERIRQYEKQRNIKLGEGFLFDIELACGYLKLTNDVSTINETSIVALLKIFLDGKQIPVTEYEGLLSAYTFYSEIRNVLYLLDLDSDSVIPENPDKLMRVARSLELKDSNELLKKIEYHRKHVISSFLNIMECRN